MSIRKGNITISGKGANGIDGTNGADGYSPIATVSKVGNTATISITDKNGTTTAQVSDAEEIMQTITSLTGTSVSPLVDSVNTLSISSNTTITLPNVSDGKFHQILIFATISGTPTISFGTTYYFNAQTPTIEAGTYNIIYEYDGTNWYVGMLKKGSAS